MNKDDYKNAINQIHASDELKEKTIRKMKQNKVKKLSYIKYLSAAAVACLVFSIGFFELNQKENINLEKPEAPKTIAKIKDDLPRFKSMSELKEALEESGATMYYNTRSATIKAEASLTDGVNDLIQNKENTVEELAGEAENYNDDYSTTNNQVTNVDEADIVKTDGKYIYYVAQGKVYVVEAKDLKIVSTIKIEEDNKRFNATEIFINDDKLIVLGNLYEYEEMVIEEPPITINDGIEELADEAPVAYTASRGMVTSYNTAKAIVYDMSDKENLKIVREFGLDGNYNNSRMIGDNIYFTSRKSAYYYDGMRDDEILPRVINGGQTKLVACTDIAYFKGSKNYSYMLVAGFNINNNDEMSVETFFGASETMYASENNLYLAQTKYDGNYYESKTTIYKFTLDNSEIILTAKGEVEGYLNNQFSMDEYEGNLRVATTYAITERLPENQKTEDDTVTEVIFDTEVTYGNRLYVLDEELKEIGRIDNLAEDEKIYSVRFMGKMGYIVTFEQVDPLFVIDLSDPTNPEVKGELKIPGYSSYLHPYDETHIIGIGYNTRSNGYGGVTNDNMKMSMFDVSDVENPKEMFSIDIGDSYTYSDIIYDHRALFYKKSANIIGFPVTYRGKSKVELFKIDLENGFEKYAEIISEKNYYTICRVQFIGDTIYTFHYNRIVAYDLNTLEKINELELD